MSRALVALPALALLGLLAPPARAEKDADAPPAGFVALFNGKDLKGWRTDKAGKAPGWGVDEGGILYVKGGGGWLMTEKEYGDFELRLEYKVPVNGNSGVGLRSPLKGDPAYVGMEIQILDDYGPAYKKLRPYQYTGSIYGVVPPSKRVTKKAGEWNSMRIVAKGRRVTVAINGTTVVDANLDDYKKDFKAHPGLLREKGHLGLQNYGGARVEFRRLYVKPL
jgi:hypothetical protein